MKYTPYIDTAFKEEIQRLKEDAYHPESNPNGIDNLPHAIKLISLSPRGQKYKHMHNLRDSDVQRIIADQLGVSKKALHHHRNNVGTLDSHIYHLNIPNRTFNALTNRGFYTIESVLNLTYERALKLRNISEAYIQDLIESINMWAKEANIDIQEFPLIQTMADPELWTIGPSEIKPYLDYPFSHILNHNEAIPIDTLNVTQNTLKALKRNRIKTLDALARRPIPQWITIKGLGRKTVMTLVLQLIEVDERIAKSKVYTATVNLQLSIPINGISKEEAYEKAIEHLHDTLNNERINMTINEKP